MADLVEVTAPSLAYMCLGGFTVAFSFLSLVIKERFFISEVVVGTAFGIAIGPHAANIFDPRSWGNDNAITLEITRIVLAFGLFAIGIELPSAYMLHHIKGLLVMIVPTMAFGWVIVATMMNLLFPSLTFLSCLVVAACLTPTDPVICAAIVGGPYALKHVPANLRHILAAEAAANDRLAYPFLSLSLYLTMETSRTIALRKWVLVGCLYEVLLGASIGALVGFLSSRLMRYTRTQGLLNPESYVTQYIALSLFTVGVVSAIRSDDLLAAFAAGCAIAWDGDFQSQVKDEKFASVIDLVLNCSCFVYIGAWIPFQSFNSEALGITPWKLFALLAFIVLFRRIPAIFILQPWIGEIRSRKEAIFCGHYGPMGVGALFISTLALDRLPKPQGSPGNQIELLAAVLHPIVSFVILGSIIIHGLSIPIITTTRRNIRLPPGWLPRWLANPDDNDPDVAKRGLLPTGVLIDVDTNVEGTPSAADAVCVDSRRSPSEASSNRPMF